MEISLLSKPSQGLNFKSTVSLTGCVTLAKSQGPSETHFCICKWVVMVTISSLSVRVAVGVNSMSLWVMGGKQHGRGGASTAPSLCSRQKGKLRGTSDLLQVTKHEN